jgi:hypothetical protein
MKSMKDQYGSKRGEQVFYASMNKGKIKGVEKKKIGGITGKKSGTPPKKGPSSQGMNLKVIKLRGGGMDMGNAANQARSAAMGNARSAPGPGDTGGAGGYDGSTQQFGAKGTSPTSTGGGGTVKPPKAPPKLPPKDNFLNTITGPMGIPPVTKFGLAVKVLTDVENARRAKRAKGEFVLSNKKVLPVTRDFYKTEKRPLQTKIGGPDEDYLKATGITGGDRPPPHDRGDGPVKTVLCPDGSMPPCVDTTKAKSVTPGGRNPVTPYKFNFEYRDGGLVRGSGKVLKGKVKKARIY